MSCAQKGASRASGAWPGSDDGTAEHKAEPAEAAGAGKSAHAGEKKRSREDAEEKAGAADKRPATSAAQPDTTREATRAKQSTCSSTSSQRPDVRKTARSQIQPRVLHVLNRARVAATSSRPDMLETARAL